MHLKDFNFLPPSELAQSSDKHVPNVRTYGGKV